TVTTPSSWKLRRAVERFKRRTANSTRTTAYGHRTESASPFHMPSGTRPEANVRALSAAASRWRRCPQKFAGLEPLTSSERKFHETTGHHGFAADHHGQGRPNLLLNLAEPILSIEHSLRRR